MKHELDKPMSLSYVMTEPTYGKRNCQNHSYPTTPDLSPLNRSIGPSSPQSFDSLSGTFSPSASAATTSTTTENYEFPPIYHHHNKKNSLSLTSDEDGDDLLGGGSGLTLLERRKRNKTASAKYRQKKNRQHIEMKRMIDHLTEQDSLLKRQMAELRMENQKLKSMNDHLRGKILAKKMLDQYFERHHLHHRNPTFASTARVSNPSDELRSELSTDHDINDIGSLDSF